jgi:PAS domain S-box-containing protein
MIKILVIDHAAGSYRGIRKVLAASGIPGCFIKFITGYRDIIEELGGNAYDVCLIDSASGNGLKLFSQARSLGFGAPVILVTSNDAREATNAIRSGIADCLIRDDMTAAAVERLICFVVEQASESAQQNQRERRYRALIDNADEVLLTHDLKGNCTSMNTAGEHLIGYSQEEWLSMSISQIVTARHREVAQQMTKQTLATRRQTFCEIEIATKDGRAVVIEVTLHLVYQFGKAVEVQWLGREVTWSKQSVAELFRNAQLPLPTQSNAQTLNITR